MRIRNGFYQPALQAFPFGFGVKKDRGAGFSILAAREMKLVRKSERGGRGRGRKETLQSSPPLPRAFTCAIFCAFLVPRSLLLNRAETLATQDRVLKNIFVALLV